MPSIAEILARKAAEKAARQPAPAPAAADPQPSSPKLTLAEKVALKEAIDRIDPPGKPEAVTPTASRILGLVVKSQELPKDSPNGEPRGQTTPVAGPPAEPERRALGATMGELIDMTPAGADAQTAAWETARTSLEGDLCVMRCPDDPETCWLALNAPGRPPLLLYRLPWLLYDHPATPRPDNEPF